MVTPAKKTADPTDPHASGPIITAGPPIETAELVLVLLHGRGGTAENMLAVYDTLGLEMISAIVPQAAGNSWYPRSFLAPLEANQPFLDSALDRIESIVTNLIAGGIPSERIALLGFSQGACLALEFVARHPRQYAAVIGLTGGLIGPVGTKWNYRGSLTGTTVFLGAGDPDPHVPFVRVEETGAMLKRMGATIELRRYPGMPHTINDDELDAARHLLLSAAAHHEHRPTKGGRWNP